MNGLETAYDGHLALRKTAGEILEFWFESLKFRLAKDLSYSPDFLVQLANGELEIHEVKGYWEDDARAKIKMAANLFPFRFIGVTKATVKNNGYVGWKFEQFGWEENNGETNH